MEVVAEREAMAKLESVALSFGKTALVVHGRSFSNRIARDVASNAPKLVTKCCAVSGSTAAEVSRIASAARETDCTISVGGGGVIDVGKMAASLAAKPFFSVPTALSSDGIASPIAVIDGVSKLVSSPAAVLLDYRLLLASPARMTAAGAGDLLANLSAVWDWRAAAASGSDDFDEEIAALATRGAHALLATDPLDRPAFVAALAEGLVSSGVAMARVRSSRPASGSEHQVCHALRALGVTEGLHGEVVALATRFTVTLQGNEHADAIVATLDALKLPARLSDIGTSLDVFLDAVERAPATRPGRTTVLQLKPPAKEDYARAAARCGLV